MGSIYQLRTKFIIESEEEEGYWKIKRGKNIGIIVWRVRFGKNSRVERAGLSLLQLS